MSYGKSNASYTVPVAESTHIDGSPRPSPSRPSLLWGGKYTPRISKMSPMQLPQSSNALNKSIGSPRPSPLDAKTHRDTLSKGLVSRLNAYSEIGEQKTRPIANRTYTRPGDLPTVNLEKHAISIKPQHTNGATIAKIGVGAPLRFNNQASSRMSIFSTGKNFGDTAPITPTATNVSIAGTSSASAPSNGNASASRDDEPIVPTSSEYDTNPTRSVLDELVEISRKRTHCDDLDGDFLKKQKADKSPPAGAQIIRQPSPPPNQVVKRGRDRTSPSYYNNSAETQKKRYRNNDILSSLSSSMHLTSPKTVRTSLNFDFDGNQSHTTSIQDKNAVKGRPALRSEGIGRNGIDVPSPPSTTPNNHDIAPVRSQASLQRELPPKVQKLTLFNKIYEPTVAATSNGKNADDQNDLDESASTDYEDNRISFVKPKTKTSTVFKVNKNGAPNILAKLLSVLSENDSHDEVDNGTKSGKAKVEESPIVTASGTASLSSGEKTTVTFSTATTTSVLSLPLAGTVSETQKNDTTGTTPAPESSEVTKSTPSAIIATSSANNANTLPKSTPLPSFGLPAKPTISFALNATTAASTSASTMNPVTTSESVPRLGGFSFSATATTPSPSLAATKTDATPSVTHAPKTSENSIPPSAVLPTFSFGKPATPANAVSTAAVTAVPATDAAKSSPVAGGFSFGASTVSKSPNLNTSFGVAATPAPTALPTTSAQSMATFLFGKSPTVSATPAAVPSFGTPSFSFSATTTAASTATATSTTSTTNTIAPTFSFGAPTTTNLSFGVPSPAAVAPAVTTSSLSSSAFSFGAATTTPAAPPSASPLTFGATNSNFTTPNLFGAKAERTVASTLTTQTAPPTNLFGTPVTTASISGFGVPNTSFNSIATTTTVPSFGASFGGSTTTTTAAPPAFGTATTSTSFGNSPAPTPVFGGFGANTNSNTSTPAFGSNVPFGMPTVTTAAQPPATNLFGSATVAAPQKTDSVFGSQSATAAAPAFGTSSFGATNNVFGNSSQTQNTNNANLFGSSNAASTSAFNFGAKVATPFGASNTAATVTETKSAFSFNAVPNANATSVTGFNSAPPNVSPFGNAAPAATNSSFSFGASTNDASKAAPSFGATPSFGANAAPSAQTAPASGVFAFGGQTTAPTTTASSGSIFGSTTTNTNSAFTFGQTANAAANSSTFAAPTNDTNTPFTFNGGANSNTAAPPAFGGSAFSFGSSTTDNSVQSNANMFGAPAAAPTPFAFGAPAAAGIAAPQTNAFQFNAQQPAPTNLFSIGPGNAPKNRPIRQATRRIKQ